jgi:hypothetical protein
MNTKVEAIRELKTIPGVGKSIAEDLWNIGIRRVSDLKRANPEKLYARSNALAGVRQDPCLLYVFRGAVYFACIPEKKRDQKLLKWWYWKDRSRER